MLPIYRVDDEIHLNFLLSFPNPSVPPFSTLFLLLPYSFCTRYGQASGRGANWHPTRGFHLLRGEAIAWLYTMPLLDAMYMIEADLAAGASVEDLSAS